MKRFFLLAATLLSLNAVAQDTIVAKVVSEDIISDKPKSGGKPNLKPYGFVRNYFYYDSRQNYSSNMGLFGQIPKDEVYDKSNPDYDLNSESEMNYLAITTRLGLNVSGVRALNADLAAKIEMDFCGFSGNNFMIRLRQAYFNMKWKEGKHTLLMGQTWHPVSGDLPDVLGLASGSPFHPFNRSPQIRYDFKTAGLDFTAAALWQFQYKSVGPTGYDSKFNKIPECYLGVDYSHNGFKIGYGVDIISIVPRTSATIQQQVEKTNEAGETVPEKVDKLVKVDERLTTCSPVLYLSYTKKDFSLKAKGILAENTPHLSMFNGYGVSEIYEDGSQAYTPIRSLTGYVNMCYGKKFKGNLFVGFSKNLGSKDELVDLSKVYTRSSVKNIDFMWRVCPAFSYNVSGFTIGLEYELTNVGYGDEVDTWGDVKSDRNVMNNRLCMMLKYAW